MEFESDNIKRILISEEDIIKRTNEIGAQITEDYKDDPPVVIGVIKGALYFFADLTRRIDLPVAIDMIGFGNIPDTTSNTGVVRITKDIDIDITGRRVIIVEDVIRTGLTTAYLISNLETKKPRDINVATMLYNPDRVLLPVPVKYVGFEITDGWLMGYGLDVREKGRNIPYIVELKSKP
ncbi:hypoxanthine phosphoribosyltransferase [Ruminococcaceae bacterium YRB3002]|nr:hypoxanthine phosphoribosyltransferase [Ruminococcaceae bacterium YRB3002]